MKITTQVGRLELRLRIFGPALGCILLMMLSGCNASHPAALNQDTEELFRAVRGGHADTVRSLLATSKADVNGRDENGNTPLILAAQNGHNEVIMALLAAKADVRAKNNQGQTALDLAAAGGHDECVRLLKQAGA